MKQFSVRCLFFLALTLLFSSTLASPLRSQSTDLQGWRPDPIEWESFEVANGDSVSRTFDLANFSVPLNWDEPGGKQITLAISRIPATTDTMRYLFINPGGPGASAADWVADLTWFDNLREQYNIIGIDPRGVGKSTPIQCDAGLWNEAYPLYPKTQAEFDARVKHNKAVGESCLKLSGDILYHVDTASVARDFEAVRQALGDKPLNYLGYSYGTQIGVQYAELFPDKVGRFVLDGVVDHSGTQEYVVTSALEANELGFNRWAQWCENTRKECNFSGKNVVERYEKLVKDADATPIPAPGCDGTNCGVSVTGQDIRSAVPGLFYPTFTWPDLGEYLHEAASGDASHLSPLPPSNDKSRWADRAVICLDWPQSLNSLSDALEREKLVTSAGPHVVMGVGSAQFNQELGCIGWPASANNPPHRPKADGVPPILLVHSLYDPAANYKWAKAVHEQFPGSVLLTRDGDEHCSYGNYREINEVVDRILLNGVMPKDGLVLRTGENDVGMQSKLRRSLVRMRW